jgi:hypothetical protein
LSVEERLARLEEKITSINTNQDALKIQIQLLIDTQIQLKDLIKWVVFPLIIGAFSLVGIKLVLPS